MFRSFLLAGVAVLGVSGCLASAGSGIILLSSGAQTTSVADQVVDRSHKGDRLSMPREQRRAPAVAIRRGEPPKPVVQKRPLGCDPLFSPATTPALKHLFGRCIT